MKQKVALCAAYEKYTQDPSNANAKYLNAIVSSAELVLPVKSSALGKGASGAPVIVKQRGDFKIMGMFTHTIEEVKDSIGDIQKAINDGKEVEVTRTHRFTDLAKKRQWIIDNIKKL